MLHDETITTPGEDAEGDRGVDRSALLKVAGAADLADSDELLRAFLLVQVWGSGLTGSRTLRHTATAFAHRDRLVTALRSSADLLRRADETSALAEAYKSWSCPGVGPSFFTKWFTFAGRREGRGWQPLILDNRVYRSLNRTLDVRLVDLADSRSRAARYRAYVEAVHAWSSELGVPADRLEWVLFRDNGEDSAKP
ncbi:STAG domain-containing protein [Georgenia sp. TF02-10]|nr:STAG domain-containing protein [Georgenia sp. TF02-10]UNX55357.1 STAG domain-containing protein [Georgenia sp. TF02-10]